MDPRICRVQVSFETIDDTTLPEKKINAFNNRVFKIPGVVEVGWYYCPTVDIEPKDEKHLTKVISRIDKIISQLNMGK